MSKTSWGLSHWVSHDNSTTSKEAYDDIKEVFLVKQWNSFHLTGKNLDYLHLKDFLKYKMWIVFEATIETTTTQDHCYLPHLKP